jgi:hypothetical protein
MMMMMMVVVMVLWWLWRLEVVVMEVRGGVKSLLGRLEVSEESLLWWRWKMRKFVRGQSRG